MNILVVTSLYPTSSSLDGREQTTEAVRDFVRQWTATGHQVAVARNVWFGLRKPSYRRLAEAYRARSDDPRVILNPCLCVNRWGLLTFAKRRLFGSVDRRISPDVVVFHMLASFPVAEAASRRYNAPLVGVLHASDVSALASRAWARARLARCDALLARSESIRRAVKAYLPASAGDEIGLALSGVPASEIESPGVYERKAIAVASDAPLRFVTCARLIALKNIDVNLRALARITDRDWTYTVVGDGPERPRLAALAAELGIASRVTFAGQATRAESLEAMLSSEVFVMASAPETLGLAFLEAMSKACIIVGASGFGIDGIVRDGENGYLCGPRSIDELERAFRSIMKLDLPGARSLLTRTRETVSSLSDTACSSAYVKFLDEVLKSKADSRLHAIGQIKDSR